MHLSSLEYRQTRAALRDAFAVVLDELDACQASLSRAELRAARMHAKKLALCADDITALCDRLVRHVHHADGQ